MGHSPRDRARFNNRHAGGRHLTLAYLIVTAEKLVSIFAVPLLLGLGFLIFAWLGVFSNLYPWLHLLVLAFFTALFFSTAGKARHQWRAASLSMLRRRVEEASQLTHRPFDVLDDRPTGLHPEQLKLWQQHKTRATEQVQTLRWPRWKLNWSEHDPYALRYGLMIAFIIGLVVGWGALSERVLDAINPTLGKWHVTGPTLNAWITPPEYTHLPPVMIATPAGVRHDGETIDVPEGSLLAAHLAQNDGDVPDLVANNKSVPFDNSLDADSDATNNAPQDYHIEQPIRDGKKIAIRQGWHNLGSWRIRVVADQPPQVSMTETPAVTERKSIRIAYSADDDYGVTDVMLRVTPKESMQGISSDPIEVPLASPDAKDVKRTGFTDLTSSVWAGSPVQLQLIAHDAAGHTAQSAPVDFTLPERIFLQPVARALIDERKKFLQQPDDEDIRNQTANLMAGIAQQPAAYRGDPVVLMALRSGAVRLILNHDPATIPSVADLIWQAAVRIEDGAVGLAEKNLRDAQHDLADALDHNASQLDIQRLLDRLRQALAQYMAELANHMAARPGPVENMSQFLGPQMNMLSPDDLNRMLDQMRDLAASGSRDAAREQLSKLQQMLENMRTQPPQLSEQQKQMMRNLLALRDLKKEQQQLLDKTFQAGQAPDGGKTADQGLALAQSALLKRLQDMLKTMPKPDENLARSAQAMEQSGQALQRGVAKGAALFQNEAVKALDQAMQDLSRDLRSSMMMLPMPGQGAMGEGQDPFGRRNGTAQDDGGVQVPDQMQSGHVRQILDELQRRAGDMNRPKSEREYIERLLRNF